MKKLKKDFLELMIYGLAAAVSGMLFFFGLLYPDYLYTEETYQIKKDFDMEEVWGISEEEFSGLSEAQKLSLISDISPSQVRYKSKLWEMLSTSMDKVEHK